MSALDFFVPLPQKYHTRVSLVYSFFPVCVHIRPPTAAAHHQTKPNSTHTTHFWVSPHSSGQTTFFSSLGPFVSRAEESRRERQPFDVGAPCCCHSNLCRVCLRSAAFSKPTHHLLSLSPSMCLHLLGGLLLLSLLLPFPIESRRNMQRKDDKPLGLHSTHAQLKRRRGASCCYSRLSLSDSGEPEQGQE